MSTPPSVTHVIDEAAIRAYAELSGDFNPLHVDPDYAASTRFGSVIAHGPLGLQAIFEALTELLGADALPGGVGLEVAYRAPVHSGDAITAAVDGRLEHAGAVVLALSVRNARGEVLIEALATVPRALAPRAPQANG